jgi:branched-chain amino acid transport system substrate-binding protein
MGQLVENAIKSTNGLDQKAIAEYLRKTKHNTIVGPMEFSPDGERKETATLIAQFRGVKDKNIDQFRTAGRQVILFPEGLKTGEVVVPFEKARN